MDSTLDFDATFGTSKPFEYWLTKPDNPIVYCLLKLDGKDFLVKSGYTVELIQKTADHDTFSITVRDDALDSFEGYVMENSKNILGKDISITYHHYGQPRQTFAGIIGGINNKKDNGSGYGDLCITGYSPSILLENGKDCQSFENKTLEQIILAICSDYQQEAKIEISSNYLNLANTKVLPYTVQYKESDYQFIRRLAICHGEFFYYNGEKLIFGNTVQPLINLGQGIDLKNIDFEMKMGAQDFKYIAYDVQTGSKIEKDSTSIQSEFKESLFQSIAVNTSNKIFRKKPKMYFNHTGINQSSESELEEAVRLEKERRENLVQVKGKSNNPELRIGGRAKLTDINGKAMETYRIIEIKHYHSGNKYYNEFVGLPDFFNASPYIDSEAVPKGEEQSARVVENNDPIGMGRVRVQFPWQEEKNQITPWIRTTTIYAGAGRGDYKVPEIGDEVLVNHESGNAEKPYVSGALYNGKETSGYHTSGNDIKAERTRSGVEELINDAEGSWKQSTPDGNHYFMDGQRNTIINVPNDFTINVGGNFNINVGQNVSFLVGLRAIYNIGVQMMMNTPVLKYLVTDNYHLQSPKTLINGEGEIKIEAKETQVAGFKKLFLHSEENAVVNSKGLVEVKGEEGTSNTNIADVVRREIPHSQTQTIIHFVAENWKGEFGFCWLRGGNKELSDSENFSRLIGRHYQFKNNELKAVEKGKKSEADYQKDIDKNEDDFKKTLEKYYTADDRAGFAIHKNTVSSFASYFITDDNTWFRKRYSVKQIKDSAGKVTSEEYEKTLIETVSNFKADDQYKPLDNSYTDLQDEYSCFHYSKFKKKKKNGKEEKEEEFFTYYQPFLALFPKTENYRVSEATFKLDITFLDEENKPDYLIFRVDGLILKADHINIGIDKLKIENPKNGQKVTITCKSAEGFTQNKKIEIYAVKIQPDKTEPETLAGCITMIAPVVKTLNLVTVKVKTQKNTENVFGKPTEGGLDFFKKALGQALIKVKIIENSNNKPVQIDVSDTPNFSTKFGVTNGAITETKGLDAVLKNKFKDLYPDLVGGHFKLYFIDVPCTEKGEEGSNTLGYSRYGLTYGVMFDKHKPATIAHECLHGMGLPHSFFLHEGSYVFKAQETNNIMDYSHWDTNEAGNARTPKERYYIMYWQWRIARGFHLFNPPTNTQ